MHHHEEGARRPVVADVVGTETLLDVGRPLGSDNTTAIPAPPLLVVVLLGGKKGLAFDPDDGLVAVVGHVALLARVARRTDHARRQRVVEVLRRPIRARPVSAVSLATVRAARGRISRFGLTGARRARVGRRRAVRRSIARRVGVGYWLLRVLLRGGGRRCDLGRHALLPVLGAPDLLGHQGADDGPVAGLELFLVNPMTQVAQPVEGDLDPLRLGPTLRRRHAVSRRSRVAWRRSGYVKSAFLVPPYK